MSGDIMPVAYTDTDGRNTRYVSNFVTVAFSVVVGNDSYYFATSDEFNRLKPLDHVVSDFRVMDLVYNFATESVQVVNRNDRVPPGYMIVRPWYPKNSYDLYTLLSTYPDSKSAW